MLRIAVNYPLAWLQIGFRETLFPHARHTLLPFRVFEQQVIAIVRSAEGAPHLRSIPAEIAPEFYAHVCTAPRVVVVVCHAGEASF